MKQEMTLKNIVKEAFIIGNDIKNKIDNHYQIFDKDEKNIKGCLI